MKKISEIGITKYLPFVVKKKSLKHYTAVFAIDAHNVEVHTGVEWKPLSDIDPSRKSIQYTVNISGPNTSLAPVDREGIQDELKVFTHTVTFSNDVSSMQDLRANVGFIVFSTVAKILNEFAEDFKHEFQCFTFTPAHEGLVPVYEILSKEAEKQGLLVYLNKNSGKQRRKWYLLNKILWEKYKKIKNIAEERIIDA